MVAGVSGLLNSARDSLTGIEPAERQCSEAREFAANRRIAATL